MNDDTQAFQSLTAVEYAGFWRRFFASIIDTIWQLPVLFLFAWLIEGPQVMRSGGAAPFSLLSAVVQYIVPAIVVLGFWIWKGATPGKMLLGMRIVDATTHEIVSTKRLIVRYLGYFPSTLVFCLGFFWVAFDKRKQGWHDKIAKTVVIRDQSY